MSHVTPQFGPYSPERISCVRLRHFCLVASTNCPWNSAASEVGGIIDQHLVQAALTIRGYFTVDGNRGCVLEIVGKR
jgi:hypothetical protein